MLLLCDGRISLHLCLGPLPSRRGRPVPPTRHGQPPTPHWDPTTSGLLEVFAPVLFPFSAGLLSSATDAPSDVIIPTRPMLLAPAPVCVPACGETPGKRYLGSLSPFSFSVRASDIRIPSPPFPGSHSVKMQLEYPSSTMLHRECFKFVQVLESSCIHNEISWGVGPKSKDEIHLAFRYPDTCTIA